MTRRSVFSDPPDDPFDDVLSSLASSPPPSSPKPGAVRVQPPTAAPESAPVPSVPIAVAPAPRAVVTLPKAKTKPKAAVGKGKRVGLYLDTNSWMALKEISLTRARKSLPTDFTTIVLEALKKEYPNSSWSI